MKPADTPMELNHWLQAESLFRMLDYFSILLKGWYVSQSFDLRLPNQLLQAGLCILVVFLTLTIEFLDIWSPQLEKDLFILDMEI